MSGSPDGDGPGWREEPSQLEELADFMEQVWVLSFMCFDSRRFQMPRRFQRLTLL